MAHDAKPSRYVHNPLRYAGAYTWAPTLMSLLTRTTS